MKAKQRILIVEDETLIAMMLERSLKDAGYEVIARVAKGREAVESATALEPDLVIMDIQLADGVSGIEAAATILARRPTVMVFLTGYSDEETLTKARMLNPAAIVEKPVNYERLEQIISTLLRKDGKGD